MDLNTILMLNTPNLYFQARPLFWASDSCTCTWFFYLDIAQSFKLGVFKRTLRFLPTCYSAQRIPSILIQSSTIYPGAPVRSLPVILIAPFPHSSHWIFQQVPSILLPWNPANYPLRFVFTATMYARLLQQPLNCSLSVCSCLPPAPCPHICKGYHFIIALWKPFSGYSLNSE